MKLYRWLIWVAFLGFWTYLLLFPVPEELVQTTEHYIGRRYIVAKTVHVTCYTILAILSGWLRIPTRFRPFLMFFIMAHGTITEHLQLFTSHRDGNLFDVGFDNCGILFGTLIAWRWWTAPDQASGSDPH
ncbi:MAG: VanZ family protein [Gemmataceae bacterium]